MTGHRDDGMGAFEIVMGGVVGFAAVVVGGVEALGGIAGVLFGDGWPPLDGADAASVVAALPQHLDDPRLAWPEPARHTLPGALAMYTTVALIMAAVGGVAAGVVAAGRRGKRRDGAAWARTGQLRLLSIGRGRAGGRLVLGRVGRRLIAAEPRQSVIVVAPTQTGKTTGLAVPAILEWEGPVLATSVKTDLVLDTTARRARLGEVKVFDPASITGLPPAHWTPLAGCADWQAARETAARLCAVAHPGRALSDADFWSGSAARYLAPLLYCAALGDHSIADVLGWIETSHSETPKQVLAGRAIEEPGGPAEAALGALIAVWEADERFKSSVSATASVALDAYGDPAVIGSALRADITPDWLLGGANTAYLCATATDQERLRPLFVTLIDQVVAEVYRRAGETGRPVDPPVLIVLDEAANIAPLPRLDQLAATGAGQGIQLVTVVQDLSQLEARWERKASTILNNHRAKVFGAGISCEKTLGYLEKVVGDTAFAQRSTTRSEHGRRSTTESTHYRPLAAAHRVRQTDPGSALLLYGHLPPARIRLRPWYADRHLRRLARPEESR